MTTARQTDGDEELIEAMAEAVKAAVSGYMFDATADAIARAALAVQRERDDSAERLARIVQWCDAYPADIFTPLTKEEEKAAVAAACAAVPFGSDRLHASWARHLLSGIREIAASGPEGAE